MKQQPMIDDILSTTSSEGEGCEFPPLDILLVEDSVVIRVALVGLLKRHNVVQAHNGAEAVAIMDKDRFDVVLMDVQMPEMDGFEATAAIREKEQGHRTPIIAMTAAALTDDRDACLAAGMDGYLSKPIRPEELHRTIDQFTRSHRAAMSEKSSGKDSSSSESLASADVIDLDAARRQLPGGEEGVRAMAQLLFEQCPIMIKEVKDALTDGDGKRIQRAAHSLKGSAELFGAARVVDVARRIELAGKRSHVDEASELMPELREQVSQLQSALAAATSSRPP